MSVSIPYTDAMTTEWCVMHPDFPEQPHRGPFSEVEALRWISDLVEADPRFDGMYYVAAREVGPWQRQF